MGFTHTVFPAEQRAVVIGEKAITLPQCFQAMITLAEDKHFKPSFSVLVDIRSLTYTPSTRDAQLIASKLGTMKANFRGKVALLVSGDFLYGMARMTCVMSEFVGFKMHAYHDYDEAVQWLISDDIKIQSVASSD